MITQNLIGSDVILGINPNSALYCHQTILLKSFQKLPNFHTHTYST